MDNIGIGMSLQPVVISRCFHPFLFTPRHGSLSPVFLIETAMDTLVTKILEVAKDAGKPKAAGKGSITLVAQDETGATPGQKPENFMDNLSQCCKT